MDRVPLTISCRAAKEANTYKDKIKGFFSINVWTEQRATADELQNWCILMLERVFNVKIIHSFIRSMNITYHWRWVYVYVSVSVCLSKCLALNFEDWTILTPNKKRERERDQRTHYENCLYTAAFVHHIIINLLASFMMFQSI